MSNYHQAKFPSEVVQDESTDGTNTESSENEDFPHNPATTLQNAPESLEEAIDRIKVLEDTLDDICRSYEICTAVGSFDMMGTFVESSLELLRNKITIVHNEDSKMNIQIVTGKLKDKNAQGNETESP